MIRSLQVSFTRLLTSAEIIRFRWLLGFMLLSALLEAGGVALIYPFTMVINHPDNLAHQPALLALQKSLGIADSRSFAIGFGGFILVFFLVKNLFLAFLIHFKYKLLFSSQVRLASELLRQYLLQPYAFHLQRDSHRLLQNLRDNALWIFSHLLDPLLVMITEIMILCLILLTLLWVNPWMSISALGASGLIGYWFFKAMKKNARAQGQRQQAHLQQMNRWLQQSLGSIKETHLHHHETYFIERYSEHAIPYAQANAYIKTLNRLPKPFFETLVMSTMALGIMAALTYQQQLQNYLPLVALFGLAALRMIPSINAILGSLGNVQFYYPALEAIQQDYHPIRAAAPSSSAQEAYPSLILKHQIELQQVQYTYPQTHQPVLKNLSLTLKKGEMVGFVGPSGAGKSTVIDLILGLLEPDQGLLLVDSIPITAHNRMAWQRQISYIPQTLYFLDDSIRHNIAFATPEAAIDDAKIAAILTTVQLMPWIQTLPQGIHTVIGENGMKLSGGQKQRLGIARALYFDAQVLVLDEATSALDSLTEQEINQAIAALHGHKTILMIAHRLATLKNADRLFYFEHGTLLGTGTYEQLYQQQPRFRAMAQQFAVPAANVS